MIGVDIENDLIILGFVKERYEDYHRTCYTNTEYEYKGKETFVELQIDYYNVSVIWHYEKRKKVSLCVYASSLLSFSSTKSFIDTSLEKLSEKYFINQ